MEAEQAALARRQRESPDPVVRARYAEAQASLEVQAQQLATIAISRDRL